MCYSTIMYISLLTGVVRSCFFFSSRERRYSRSKKPRRACQPSEAIPVTAHVRIWDIRTSGLAKQTQDIRELEAGLDQRGSRHGESLPTQPPHGRVRDRGGHEREKEGHLARSSSTASPHNIRSKLGQVSFEVNLAVCRRDEALP